MSNLHSASSAQPTRLHVSPIAQASAYGAAETVAELGCGAGKRRRLASKGVLYHEGDAVESVYVIRRGMVKLVSYLPNGRARIVRLHCRGQVLGLEGLIPRPFEHSAIAVGEIEVEHVPMGRLRRLQHEDPVALNGLLFQWHDALAQADKWIADFSTGEIKPRVARLLQYLATFDCGPANGTFGLLTVEELAEILGATPESVSRHLAAFKRQDILHREVGASRKVYRLDVERVQCEAIE